jgi:NHLM bacteriocin system ABC transporter peptidase/ATP-binding protein
MIAPLERAAEGVRRLRPGGGARRRVRVPTVLQMEAVECGAAALGMVLAAHGRSVPLEELRVACGVSRDGSKASNIVRAARQYGVDARGFKMEPSGLRDAQLPAVLHWNFNHFVVLEGFGRKERVYLNDPAYGERIVTETELDQAFTGVALTFTPGPDFRRGGERRGLMAALGPRLASAWGGVVFVVLAGLLLVVPGLVVPSFTRVFVDDVLVKGMTDWVRPLLGAMIAAAACLALLTALQQRYLLRLETRLAVTTSARFFWHVLHLPMQFMAQRFPGEIAGRVGINDRVAQLLSGDLATAALSTVLVAFYALLMFQYDGVLTAVVVATAAVNLVVLHAVTRRLADLNQRMMQDRGKAGATAMSGLMNIETLKSTGSETDFFSRWAGYYAKVVNSKQELGRRSILLAALPGLLMALSTALILGIGGTRVMDGRMSMGMLVAFQALMIAFVTPVNQLFALGPVLQEARAGLNRLDDVLRAEVRIENLDQAPEDEGEAPTRLQGQLELQRVSFAYSRLDRPLIQDFSLTVRPGWRVALVGGSGSGKSTVGRLVAGLYEPWAGEIRFDGVRRGEIPRHTLTGSVAVVDQEIFLFEGTVYENLTMWDATVPEADVVQAARDACIHDDVSARPGGYASRVEEGGRNFSGGQRQRLEIARALAGNPSVLVLDEATSALDPTTEAMIDDNLRRRGCTCLIVAHRLSTIRDCDEIVVLDAGRIAQRGTHERLKDEPGLYRDLVTME